MGLPVNGPPPCKEARQGRVHRDTPFNCSFNSATTLVMRPGVAFLHRHSAIWLCVFTIPLLRVTSSLDDMQPTTADDASDNKFNHLRACQAQSCLNPRST
jgi:hypothetical protein